MFSAAHTAHRLAVRQHRNARCVDPRTTTAYHRCRGYFTLKNTGSETAVIERIKSACCAEVAMHKVIAIGDQMRMTPMLNLTVLPGKTVSFTTGSAHLMLIAPTTPLRRGQIVELDFICSDGDSLRTSFDVVYSQ